jgi:ornithine--oxo-acid transaminase
MTSAKKEYDAFAVDLDPDVVATEDVLALAAAVVAEPAGRAGVVVARADRAEVVDLEGRRYVDCLSGAGGSTFGHRHPRLLAEAQRQLERAGQLGAELDDEQLARFSRDLAVLVGQSAVRAVESADQALALAVTAARAWVGRPGSLSPEGVPVVFLRAGSSSAARPDITGPSVLVVEPVDPDRVAVVEREVLAAAAAAVRAAGGLVVADERRCGLGRCGHTLLLPALGVAPDVVVLGEALGGGLARIAAVAGPTAVLANAEGALEHRGTRDPLAAAVAHEVVHMLTTGEYQRRAALLGERLRAGLEGLSSRRLLAVRGVGLWAGLDLGPRTGFPGGSGTAEDAAELATALVGLGVLVSVGSPGCIVLTPPLVCSEATIDIVVGAVRDALHRA